VVKISKQLNRDLPMKLGASNLRPGTGTGVTVVEGATVVVLVEVVVVGAAEVLLVVIGVTVVELVVVGLAEVVVAEMLQNKLRIKLKDLAGYSRVDVVGGVVVDDVVVDVEVVSEPLPKKCNLSEMA
jgi:hypothetical protein